jgi:flavin-dependent dehydrogenase
VDDHVRLRADPADFREGTFRTNPQTAARMNEIDSVSGLSTGRPADSVWREACGPGWALVGDAATAQDPWAGLGMDTAARQAEALAEAYAEGVWDAVYARLRRERTYPGFAQATRLAADLRQLVGDGPPA